MNRVIFMSESPLRWWRMALVSHLLHHFHHSSKIEKLNSLKKEAIIHFFFFWKDLNIENSQFHCDLIRAKPNKRHSSPEKTQTWSTKIQKLWKKLVKMKVKREKIKEIFLICYNSKKNYKRKNKDLDTGKVEISHCYLLYEKLTFYCQDHFFTIFLINKKLNLNKWVKFLKQ